VRRQRAKKPPEEVLWGIVSHPKYKRDHELAPVTLLQSPKTSFSAIFRFWTSSAIPQRRAGVGGLARHRAVVPAVVLSRTEPHRTTLEGHEAARPLRSPPPDLPGLSSRHPRGSRRSANQVLPATGFVDNANFPAIRRRLAHGCARYNANIL